MKVYEHYEGYVAIEYEGELTIIYPDRTSICFSCMYGEEVAAAAMLHPNWKEIELTDEIRAQVKFLGECRCL